MVIDSIAALRVLANSINQKQELTFRDLNTIDSAIKEIENLRMDVAVLRKKLSILEDTQFTG